MRFISAFRKKITKGGDASYVWRRDSIFAIVKLLTPMLRIFPFVTSASMALHVSAIGTSMTAIWPVVASTGNRSGELGKATGQWI